MDSMEWHSIAGRTELCECECECVCMCVCVSVMSPTHTLEDEVVWPRVS